MRIVRRFCGSSVGKKVIMSLTGIGLACFLVIHLLGNSSMYFGPSAFNSYAAHLHEFDPFLKVFEVGLLLLFLIHIGFGVSLFIHNLAARPSRYAVKKSSGGRTLGSATMLYTGLIVLAFIIYHFMSVAFAPHSSAIADVIRTQLQALPTAILYIVGIAALLVHLSHGLWSLWQSVGGSHPAYDTLLRRGALGFALVIGAVFISFPVLALMWDEFLR